MTCEQARQAMLDADPAELTGQGSSALVGHLASCTRCAGRAHAILEGQQALAAALRAQRPRVAAVEALRAAQVAAAMPERRWRGWRIALPGALAAGIALLLLWTRWNPPAERTVAPESAAPALPPFAVQGPPGRTVAVFRTANPDIVVVWYF